MSASEVLLGAGLTIVLAIGAQVLAMRLRIPLAVLVLPAGFIAGALTRDASPKLLLGHALHPLIALGSAVVLYATGMNVNLRRLTGHTRRVVFRLLAVGMPVTLGLGAAAAALLLGMSPGPAVVTGAVLMASGPTVVGPLLALVRPSERLRRVLSWESALAAPVGAVVSTLVFLGVLATAATKIDGLGAAGLGIAGEGAATLGVAGQIGWFVLSVVIGAAGGLAGTAVAWLLLNKLGVAQTLGACAQVAIVVGVAAVCDVLADNSGLIAAVVMGMALARLPGFEVRARRAFRDTLLQLIIGVLLVAIAATVTPASLGRLVLPVLGVGAVLVLIARPLTALAGTWRTGLTRRERLFAAAVAPRGPVPAVTAATFAAPLVAGGLPGAARILPVTLLVIVLTMLAYGVTAAPAARRLGVLRSPHSRPLLVGGDNWVIDLGLAFQAAGLDVLMWAGQEAEREKIRDAALPLIRGELLASIAANRAELSDITMILMLTAEDDFNALAAALLRGSVQDRVFRVAPQAGGHGVIAAYSSGDLLFAPALNRAALASRYRDGARIVALRGQQAAAGYEPLFLIRADGRLEPVTRGGAPRPGDGDTVVALSSEGQSR
ncbi:MAG TPA: cation:proton antiporter [Streptosporangiaceae bacterium]